jgi:hypothetical protein
MAFCETKSVSFVVYHLDVFMTTPCVTTRKFKRISRYAFHVIVTYPDTEENDIIVLHRYHNYVKSKRFCIRDPLEMDKEAKLNPHLF